MSTSEEPSIKPHPDVQKLLVSTTSRFIGELDLDGIFMSHASRGLGDAQAWARLGESPVSRSAYVLSFRTPPQEEPMPGVVIPSYEHVGETVCAYLSVLYGKRFDFHGSLESSGFFGLPELRQYASFCRPWLPQNSHEERVDHGVPLNLDEARRILPLLNGTAESTDASAFRAASKFYLQALQTVEHDPEVAYLALITAGEIVANAVDIDVEDLRPQEINNALRRVAVELHEGEQIARLLGGQMRQIKRRFAAVICCLVDERFFACPDPERNFRALQPPEFQKRIAAAYDLRSRYVHGGVSFGGWIAPRGKDNAEIQSGKPIVEDKEFGRILTRAPTYVGLERTIRYSLLRFALDRGLITE